MRKTILVVDDEPIHREILFSALNEQYDLLIFSSYENAENQIRSKNMISALVTDYSLKDSKGRTGVDLATVFREKYLSASLVLFTGAVLSEAEEFYFTQELGGKFLAKPSSSARLVEYLAESQ